MNVRELFTIGELFDAEMKGFITRRKHPHLPLYIYNYTNKTQLENHWTRVTRACRGLILDQYGDIIARPFEKFFNLDTESEPSTHVNNLPDERPLIMEKLDGSLGIFWRWYEHCGVATRGSFESEQAKWATEWYTNNISGWKLPNNMTPCFEIIYPENRIVVDYGREERLVLLGIVDNLTGREMTHQQLIDTDYPDIVQVYENKSLKDCLRDAGADLPLNREGYVLKYDTQPYPLRVKVKFIDYIRLHKLIFSLSDKTIYEFAMSGGMPEDLLKIMPEDAERWATEKQKEFVTVYNMYRSLADRLFAKRPISGTRKDHAMYFKEYPEIQSALFAMLDGKDSDAVIWKKIKPEQATLFRRDVNVGQS